MDVTARDMYPRPHPGTRSVLAGQGQHGGRRVDRLHLQSPFGEEDGGERGPRSHLEHRGPLGQPEPIGPPQGEGCRYRWMAPKTLWSW